MNADDPLLKILACPIDKGPLSLVPGESGGEDALYNPRLRRLYPIEDGVPQLLPSCGRPVDDAEHERLTARTARTARTAGTAGASSPTEAS